MTPECVVMKPHPEYGIRMFHCAPLHADLTAHACAANFVVQKSISCKGCAVGSMHSGAPIRTAIDVIHDPNASGHEKINAAAGLDCIRCGRTALTATKYIARFRLVDRHTLCLNCYNRGQEIAKFRAGIGGNSKGGVPQKWSNLKQATITIETESGEWQTLDIGLRAGRGECERYVERTHSGCELVECFIDGEAIPEGTPDAEPQTPRGWCSPHCESANEAETPKRAYRKRDPKPLPVATDAEAAISEDDRQIAQCRAAASAPRVDWDDWDTPLYRLGNAHTHEKPLTAFGFPSDPSDLAAWLASEWPEYVARPAAPVVRAPDPLDVLDAEGGMQYATVEPPAPVAEPAPLPSATQPAQQPVRKPQPAERVYDMSKRKDRREFARKLAKEQRRNAQPQQQPRQFPAGVAPTPAAVAAKALSLVDQFRQHEQQQAQLREQFPPLDANLSPTL
ncbi:hypothetical protein [Paraburkholderia sp. A1RO-5L]|uniref:hypothetical protein n=1 Tax=Paraburkholderia sp. A1RO-5L TaxID=3028370 RepID=UPI003B7FE0A8